MKKLKKLLVLCAIILVFLVPYVFNNPGEGLKYHDFITCFEADYSTSQALQCKFRNATSGIFTDTNATMNPGVQISGVEVACSPHGDECAACTLTTAAGTNIIQMQFINLSSLAWYGNVTLFSGTSATQDDRLGCSVAYEQTSGDFLVVYPSSSSANTIGYRTKIKGSAALSAETNFSDCGAAGSEMVWSFLETVPNTDHLGLITQDDAEEVCANIWNGTNFGSVQQLDFNADQKAKGIDVVYLNKTNEIWFVWSNESDTTNGAYLRNYSITSGTWDANILKMPNTYGESRNIDACSHPTEAIFTVCVKNSNTAVADIYCNIYNATSATWLNSSSASTIIEDTLSQTAAVQNFGCLWTDDDYGIIAYEDILLTFGRIRWRNMTLQGIGDEQTVISLGDGIGGHLINLKSNNDFSQFMLGYTEGELDYNTITFNTTSKLWGSNVQLSSNTISSGTQANHMPFDMDYINTIPELSDVSVIPELAITPNQIVFSAAWTDRSAGERVKIHVCKTDSILTANQSCDGTSWCDSASFTTENPVSCTYTSLGSDEGTNTFFAFVCDDQNACSASNSKTFDIISPSTVVLSHSGNNTVHNSSVMSFVVNITDNENIRNVSVYLNTTGNFVINQTKWPGEIKNDSSTTLLLRFDNSTTGFNGEVPQAESYSGFLDGIFGKGINITGSDFINYSIPGILSNESGTIEMWVKSSWDYNDGQQHYFAAHSSNLNKRISFLKLGDAADNQIRCQYKAVASSSADIDISFWKKDVWYHVGCTWNSATGLLTVYVNDRNVSSQILQYFSGSISDIFIGSAINQNNQINGTLDDVRLSNISRTLDQMNQTYQNGTALRNIQVEFNITNFRNGNYKWNVLAVDNDSYYSFAPQNFTFTINHSPPYMEVSLINPANDSNTNVVQNRTFIVNVTVYCRNGGCSNVNATVKYNFSSAYPDTPVNITSGDVPFYVAENPPLSTKSCPTNPLDENEFCNITWLVNATGRLLKNWTMGVLFESSNQSIDSNNTRNGTVTILQCITDFSLDWDSTNFGTLVPNTQQNAASGNNNNLYNITINPGSCNLDLSIKGSSLTNSSLQFSLGVGNITWSNTTNDYSSSLSLMDTNSLIRGNVPSLAKISTWYWINVPPIYAGNYNGTIYITGVNNGLETP